MARRQLPQAYQDWRRIVIRRMGHLSKPQAIVLAMWSFGIVMTHSCGISSLSVLLAELLGEKENTIRERLRQWYRERSDKAGRKRSEIAVSASFVPLLEWILGWWHPQEKQVVLAADASTLGQRFTLLVISVVYRGCGLPVAWKIMSGNEPGSWKPHWLKLLAHLKAGIPEDWCVLVTTDRGLYARWFYQAIQACQWHPFMRINAQGYYQQTPQSEYLLLANLVTQVGQTWSGAITCFKSQPLTCTLLACWDEGYQDPWLIVTDLPVQQAQIYWYGMRSWIECLFKDIKRGGFGWHHTKMSDPQRVERLWLAIAVAMIWLVSVGGKADAQLSASGLPTQRTDTTPPTETTESPSESPQQALPQRSSQAADKQSHRNTQPRWLSCLRRGYLVILAAVIRGSPIPLGGFFPEPWPSPELTSAPG